MILEAHAANCCCTRFVLKANDHPVGWFVTGWFSGPIDIAMTQRRRLRFEPVGWNGSQFILKRKGQEEAMAWARSAGFFTSALELCV